MFYKVFTVCFIFLLALSGISQSQDRYAKPYTPGVDADLLALSGISQSQDRYAKPYTPGVDADIDMYFGNWKESMPQHTHGSLIERVILTRGDPMNPPRKGAVLKNINRYSYASLIAYDSS